MYRLCLPIAILIRFFCPSQVVAQSKPSDEYRLAFYNVENLFDTDDDTLTIDEEYVWGGVRGWNYQKLSEKYLHIYKVLAALGEWNPPAMIGLAEVENEQVLKELIDKTPLHRFGYNIVHHESPDERGIDVALLYRPDLIKIIESQAWSVVFPHDPTNKTRDMLYVHAQLGQADTVHLVVNHWPSRRSGDSYRITAAKTLLSYLDTLQHQYADPKIILTGDFNDEPEDPSLQFLQHSEYPVLINLSQQQEGTIKHRSEWAVFDQFLVSENLLNETNTIFVKSLQATTFKPLWLLEKDIQYGGLKPLRTYLGYRYQGGFSDHLPVFIDLKRLESPLAEN